MSGIKHIYVLLGQKMRLSPLILMRTTDPKVLQVWFNTNLNQLSLSHSKSYLIKVRLTSHNFFIRRLSYYAKKDNYAVDKR